MKKALVICLVIFLAYSLKAQYYSIGEDPSGIHWRQIETTNFQIIFPAVFESKAQYLAFVLEKVYLYAGKTLHHQPHRISVILHTRLVTSNGLVSWAPARMELFTAPPQDTYAQEWLEQLAIHEFRHVVQMDKINSEIPNIFRIILGEQASAAVVGAYLPLWLMEGDAVVAETSLTQTGRGRLPSFEMELKAQILDKKIYRYDKAYLGSFKDYVPDYYQTGYQMVAGARERYGAELWGNILHRVARNPLSITSFSGSLKKYTGKNQNGLYQEIFRDLRTKWREEDQVFQKNDAIQVTKKNRFYTSYQDCYFVNDSTYFALKNSIDSRPSFVLIYANGKEKKIFTPGIISDKSITFSGNRILWIETKPDPRWANQEFSLLRIYDLRTGKLFQKRYKQRLYAPDLSYDKKYISCVKTDERNFCSILLISPDTGEIIKEMPAPNNLFFITPKWGEDHLLYGVALGKEGKSIVQFNPFNGEMNFLMPSTYNNLNDPVKRGNYVYFNNSAGSVDNIYALDLEKKKLFQVTDSRYGTQQPQCSPDGKILIYSDYTADGFRLMKISLEKEKWKEVDSRVSSENELVRKISEQEGKKISFEGDLGHYDSKKYSKAGHLFNFHSWAPFRLDVANEEIRPGFSVLSQNLLSTAILQAGYDYSTINKTGKWFAKIDYTGWLPVLSFDAEYGGGKSHYYQITRYQNQAGQVVRTDTNLIAFGYKELDLTADLKIPLNLTHGKYIRVLQPEIQVGYTNIKLNASVPAGVFHGSYIPFTYRFYGSNYIIPSYKDLQPEFGQVINLNYRNTPFGDHRYGAIYSGETTLYFPGVVKHQGIRIYGGIQFKNSPSQSISDLIYYPRGYQNITNNRLFTIRTDYVLPLFYPDLSLSNVSYLKRISFRAFYDHAGASLPIAGGNDIFKTLDSMGSELTTDCHFFRFIFPFTLGVRHSYLLETNHNVFEFLFSMNFYGFRTFK